MQGYCPSRSAVVKFRGETVYIEFMKQWNVGVYFSLRYAAHPLDVLFQIVFGSDFSVSLNLFGALVHTFMRLLLYLLYTDFRK